MNEDLACKDLIMAYEPSGPFITSVLELKLDTKTMFKWQKHSQDCVDVPHYQELLKFIDFRAQASEGLVSDTSKKTSKDEQLPIRRLSKQITSMVANTVDSHSNYCILCKKDNHPLYICSRFKLMNHNQRVSVIKSNNLWMNCLGTNDFVRECKSNHKCKRCQRLHHTLLHEDFPKDTPSAPSDDSPSSPVTSHTAVNAGLKSSSLLMTYQILIVSPNGSSSEARAILDSASSASFISDHLARTLNLPRLSRNTHITGIAGLSHKSPTQSITNFVVSPSRSPSPRIQVSAIIVPQVTCDLPLHSVPFDLKWDHLSDLQLADPDFRRPGRISILLGIDISLM